MNKRARTHEGQQSPSLVIVGAGLRAPRHLTREASVEIAAADVVFGSLNSAGPDRRWLELTFDKPVLDLNQFYPTSADDDRSACYVQAAAVVMREVARGRRVCVVTYGHPSVLDCTTELLEKGCRLRGWPCVVLPGVSALDTLFADLGIDPSEGLLVSSAQRLLDRAFDQERAQCALSSFDPLAEDAAVTTAASNAVAEAVALGIGPDLAHLVLLGPDAVGDRGDHSLPPLHSLRVFIVVFFFCSSASDNSGLIYERFQCMLRYR